MLPFVDIASFQIVIRFCMFWTGLALMHLQADMCLPYLEPIEKLELIDKLELTDMLP